MFENLPVGVKKILIVHLCRSVFERDEETER